MGSAGKRMESLGQYTGVIRALDRDKEGRGWDQQGIGRGQQGKGHGSAGQRTGVSGAKERGLNPFPALMFSGSVAGPL